MKDSIGRLVSQGKTLGAFSCSRTYRLVTTAPIDRLWGQLANLADLSWHPLLAKTNLPLGLMPKPGLIFQAVTRLTPIPIRLFVENARPGQLLSFRLVSFPGLEQKITYQMESTLLGTYLSYSVTLRGWLSPLIWWLIKPYSDRVVGALAQAVERRV